MFTIEGEPDLPHTHGPHTIREERLRRLDGCLRLVPRCQRTVGISIKQTGAMFGGTAGAALLPYAAYRVGWRVAVMVSVYWRLARSGWYTFIRPRSHRWAANPLNSTHRRQTSDDPPPRQAARCRPLSRERRFVRRRPVHADALHRPVFHRGLATSAGRRRPRLYGMQLMGIVSRIGFGYLTDEVSSTESTS